MRKGQHHTRQTKDKLRRKLIGISIKNFHKIDCTCAFCNCELSGNRTGKSKKIGYIKKDSNGYYQIKINKHKWISRHRIPIPGRLSL